MNEKLIGLSWLGPKMRIGKLGSSLRFPGMSGAEEDTFRIECVLFTSLKGSDENPP